MYAYICGIEGTLIFDMEFDAHWLSLDESGLFLIVCIPKGIVGDKEI